MKYKANHNLLLPDGKTEVKAGEIFEYDGNAESFLKIVEPLPEAEAPAPESPANNENPKNKEETPAAFGLEGLSDEEIRAQGKAWKIKNAHNLNIDTLKARIYEAYEKAAPEAPEALKKPDAGFEVDNIPETPENKSEEEGAANAGE
ncbi:MAG: hypothetical protein J6M62_10330 [Selenomonadaceae bacterium]|nr:hypothetical protein [Selenomonadaceae bacterium]